MKFIFIPIILVGICLLYFVFVGLSVIPGLFLLPKEKKNTIDGVTTIQDGVRKSRETGLSGWDLVEYAQNLTARKFTYSRRNSWESPGKAFARGMGYCYQQSLALQKIYDGLGIPSILVYGKGHFPESLVHGVLEPASLQNHAWLEVNMNGESRYVCPGNASNTPGRTHFTIATQVKEMSGILRFFTFTGAIIINAVRDFRSTRFRRESKIELKNEVQRGRST